MQLRLLNVTCVLQDLSHLSLKYLEKNFIDVAIDVMLDKDVKKVDASIFDLNFVGVKAPQFSFTRLGGADPKLGVEMTSTGEVACLGENYSEALLQSLVSVGYKFPIKSVLLSTGSIESKAKFLSTAKILKNMGIKIYGTRGTAKFLCENGYDAEALSCQKQKKGLGQLIISKKVRLTLSSIFQKTLLLRN